jgi:hypothetical protein
MISVQYVGATGQKSESFRNARFCLDVRIKTPLEQTQGVLLRAA